MGGAFGSYVRGRIDHVQIYNYARSVAQVSWDYNRGAPVAHWKMDECQGSTLYDSSGNGLLGTYVMGGSGGATIGDCVTNASTPRYNGRVGKFNNALDFDGSTNYVTITGTVPVDSVQGSYSAWIKTGTDFGSDGTILSGCGTTIVSPCPGNGYGAQSEIHLHVTSDERIGLFMLGGDNNISITSPAGKTYNDSQWHHVVATWSTSGGTLTARIYIDGKLVVSGSDVELAYNILNNQFTIGVMSDLSSRQFVGSIDDVKVYNYALTDTQIKGVYNGGAAVRFGPATGTP